MQLFAKAFVSVINQFKLTLIRSSSLSLEVQHESLTLCGPSPQDRQF